MAKKCKDVEEEMDDPHAIEAELVRRLEQEKWRFYEPSVRGEDFIKAVAGYNRHGQKIFIVLYSAANGIGKTVTGANIVANILWPSDNPYFQDPFFKDWKYPKRGRIVSDPTNIPKNIIPTLKFWFPDKSLKRYTTKKGHKEYEQEWKTDTGFEFDIMSYEQDPREFEGPTCGWIWLDEPPSEAILKACISRTRKGGIIFITATPLAGSAYLYDMFAQGETVVEIPGPGGEIVRYTRPVKYIEADVWSACRDIEGTRGHLAKEDILKMVAEYSEDERQARIYGKFQHLVGLVFKKWNRNVHVIRPFDINPEDYVVWNMLDPHPRNPDAVLWVAIDKYGRKFAVDELYEPMDGTSHLARRIKEKDSLYRVVKHIADPSAFVANQHDEDGLSLGDRLSQKHSLTYEPGTKQRAQADKRIEDALTYVETAGCVIKPPEVYVFESCKRLIFEIEHYRWDEWTGKSADKRNRKEKPIDKDDHLIEDLGRCLIQEPMFSPMPRRASRTSRRDTHSLDPFD